MLRSASHQASHFCRDARISIYPCIHSFTIVIPIFDLPWDRWIVSVYRLIPIYRLNIVFRSTVSQLNHVDKESIYTRKFRSTVSQVNSFGLHRGMVSISLPSRMWVFSIYRLTGWTFSIYRLTGWTFSIYRLTGWKVSIYRLTAWKFSIYRLTEYIRSTVSLVETFRSTVSQLTLSV